MAKITKTEARRFLARVPGEYVFRCHDSCVMNDLAELTQSLGTMSDDTYVFHASETNNDFSNWIADIIGDRELAASIRKAKDRIQAARIVSDRIAFLRKLAS